MKAIYEILDEFEAATNKAERMKVIENNLSHVLVDVFKLTYHPAFQWMITEMPEDYRVATDVLPGITYSGLNKELRRLYCFRKGDPTAEKLTEKRRMELLFQILNSIEPREAEVVLGIFQKDLGVPGLDYKFVKEAFPNLLP
jgi:hypothetical protein